MKHTLKLHFHFDEEDTLTKVDIAYQDEQKASQAPVGFDTLLKTTLLDFLLKLETSCIRYESTDDDILYDDFNLRC